MQYETMRRYSLLQNGQHKGMFHYCVHFAFISLNIWLCTFLYFILDTRCMLSTDSVLYVTVDNMPDWVLTQINKVRFIIRNLGPVVQNLVSLTLPLSPQLT